MCDRRVSGHVFIATSLDGYIARSVGAIDWLDSVALPDEDYGYAAFVAGMDAILMGRRTFETVLAFDPWPYQLPVILLSRSLDAARMPERLSEQLLLADTLDTALALAATHGWHRLYVDGGTTIQSCLGAGAIDEIIINRLPILLGEGRPLFGALAQDQQLRHDETCSFASGLVQSCYTVLKQADQARPEYSRQPAGN